MAATATDASRSSSSGSADSYIGSLISLTSKSEIRYEGLLFNINAEESSIGLRNVRSFGTEGRKKDGLQVPPSDKVYEYILFRGSDIKDLQVKSSPPVQVTTTPVYEDPAIIQTHYPQATSPSVSLASSGPATVQSHYPKATNPSVIPSSGPALIQTQYPQATNPLVSIPSSGSGSVPDLSAQNLHAGFPRPTLQGNLSLYQPIGGLVSWGSSPPIPATNGSAVAPMYWQGYYGPSNGFQSQQQTLFRPPPGLPLPSSFQQMTQQSGMSTLFPTGESSMEALKSSESSSALLPPHSTATPNLQSSVFPFQPPSLGMGTLNLQSQMLPTQPSPVFSASSTNLIPNNVSIAAAATSLSFPLVSPLISSLGKPTIQPQISEEPITVPKSKVQMKPLESLSIAGMSSSILNEGARPTLITPGQLLQPGPSAVSSSQPLQTSQKDAEVVKVSSSALLSSQVAIDAQKPILPLPSPADKPQGAYANYRYNYRGGGHQRGRGNRMPRPVTRFTEEFDFIAMNEKFNKDEVWGDLGKSSKAPEDGNESEDEDIAGSSRPVYVKDDFFDELSCDAFDHGSQSSRARFSERLRKDSETFGFIPRQQGGRGGYGSGRGYGPGRGGYGPGRGYGPGQGGYGPGRGGHGYGRGGQSNEAYYGGRGSSYVERDRGHNFPGRGT